MGKFDKEKSVKIGRDNKTIFVDSNKFGQEWQVLPGEPHLFHDMGDGPQAPSKCLIPTKKDLRRRLSETTITIEEAEMACAGVGMDNPEEFDLCVFDVMASGDMDMSGAY